MGARARPSGPNVYLAAVVVGAFLACRASGTAAVPGGANTAPSGPPDAVRAETCAPNALALKSATDSTEVDKRAAPRPGGPYPRYPRELRERDVEGKVRLLFVVDTLGRAEMCTVRVMVSTDPLFTDSVLDVLPRMRFFPAERAGRKVRQRLELPVEFRLSRPRGL